MVKAILVLCVYVVSVSAIGNHTKLFQKCCPEGNSVLKASSFNATYKVKYKCIDADYSVNKDHDIDLSDLISYSLPDDCELYEALLSEDDSKLISDNICYDKLSTEFNNDTNAVFLRCNKTNLMPESEPSEVINILKCCPKGLAYDTVLHACTNDYENNNEDWFRNQFRTYNANIVTVSKDPCLVDNNMFVVELKEDVFRFSLSGGALKIRNEILESNYIIPKEHWCVDKDFYTRTLVARVCALNCNEFGVFCIRKCCGIGKILEKQGDIFQCTFNTRVLFNVTSYMEPFRPQFVADAIGIKTGEVKCPEGTFPYIMVHYDGASLVDSSKDWWIRIGGNSVYDYCVDTLDTHSNGFIVTAESCSGPVNTTIPFVLVSISAACLLVTLVVYCSVPELRNLHGLTLICHVSAMLLVVTCYLFTNFTAINRREECIALGYGYYFGMVAAFFWLNVMCVDIWWKMSHIRIVQASQKGSAVRKKFLKYSLYAWGMPLALTLVTFLLDEYPLTPVLDANMGRGRGCWFESEINTENDWPRYVFFLIPLIILVIVNIIFWVLTVVHCLRVRAGIQQMQDDAKHRFIAAKDSLMLIGRLGVVMGVPWIMELGVIPFLTPDEIAETGNWVNNIIVAVNQLEGLWIFLVLVFKPVTIYNFLKTKLQNKEYPKPSTQIIQTTTGATPTKAITQPSRINAYCEVITFNIISLQLMCYIGKLSR